MALFARRSNRSTVLALACDVTEAAVVSCVDDAGGDDDVQAVRAIAPPKTMSATWTVLIRRFIVPLRE
jgi:hypothetical protein